MRHTHSFLLLLLISTLILSACATQNGLPDHAPEGSWQARGKFSFQSSQDRESGNFDWQQVGNYYDVRLFGPLGFGTVRIQGDDREVLIRNAGQERRSSFPDDLLYQMTGMSMPITEIPDWMTGNPDNLDNATAIRDAEGHLVSVIVDDWNISYENDTAPPYLPKKIHAENQDVKLTLIVLDWNR